GILDIILFSSRRRHTRCYRDWSSDVCSSDLTPGIEMTGLTLAAADTLLTDRAADFLAAGPADAQALISHVCQLPGAPRMVAEHRSEERRVGEDGRWRGGPEMWT